MDMLNLLRSFEREEENLFDWEDNDLWPMEFVPGNSLNLLASNSLQDTVLIQEGAPNLEKEEIPRTLLEDEPEPAAVSPQSKEVRHSKSAKKERKPPLYTEDPSKLGNSPDKQRSYKKSLACKLYRDRKKAEKLNIVKENEENKLLISRLLKKIENLQQENQNLKKIISREETFFQKLE